MTCKSSVKYCDQYCTGGGCNSKCDAEKCMLGCTGGACNMTCPSGVKECHLTCTVGGCHFNCDADYCQQDCLWGCKTPDGLGSDIACSGCWSPSDCNAGNCTHYCTGGGGGGDVT